MLLRAFRPQTTTEDKKVTNSERSRGICSSADLSWKRRVSPRPLAGKNPLDEGHGFSRAALPQATRGPEPLRYAFVIIHRNPQIPKAYARLTPFRVSGNP